MYDKNTYRIPKGVEVKPSQIGYYNYWYPSEDKEFLISESVEGQFLGWRGSDTWAAIKVKQEIAKKYESPIQVLWIKKELFNTIKKAPVVRTYLKSRGDEK